MTVKTWFIIVGMIVVGCILCVWLDIQTFYLSWERLKLAEVGSMGWFGGWRALRAGTSGFRIYPDNYCAVRCAFNMGTEVAERIVFSSWATYFRIEASVCVCRDATRVYNEACDLLSDQGLYFKACCKRLQSVPPLEIGVTYNTGRGASSPLVLQGRPTLWCRAQSETTVRITWPHLHFPAGKPLVVDPTPWGALTSSLGTRVSVS